MKKLKYCSMAAIAILAVSCNNLDETPAVTDGELTPLSFSIESFKGATKAAETNASNYATQITSFGVLGYFDASTTGVTGAAAGQRYLGSSDTSPVQIDGSGGNYTYHSAADMVMWPAITAPLNFQAFTPISGGGIGAVENTVSSNLPHLAVNVVVPTDNASQKDIMFAQALAQTSATNNKVVKMPFVHAMAAIRFSAKTTASSISAKIKNVTIANVVSTGKVGYLTDNTLGSSLGSARASYSIGMKSASVDVGTTSVDLTATDGTCILLPQTLTKWVPAAGTAVTTETAKSYLIVECMVIQNGVYLVGDGTNYGKVYVPFNATWEQGKKYTYTINIGSGSGGYDANGNPLLTPISFSASAANWTDSSGSVTF